MAPAVTDSLDLAAIQIDKIALHHELTFFSRTDLKSEEIAANALRNRFVDDATSFRENIAIMDATPAVIKRLLTEVHSPFPMTHAGALLMLGHRLVQETDPGAAKAWLDTVRSEMEQNYGRIDTRSESGEYTPSRSARKQGLPSFRDELRNKFPGEHQYVPCAWE